MENAIRNIVDKFIMKFKKDAYDFVIDERINDVSDFFDYFYSKEISNIKYSSSEAETDFLDILDKLEKEYKNEINDIIGQVKRGCW